MPRISLHGVPIAWSCEGPAQDPLAELLEALGPAEGREGDADGVEIIVRPASEGDADDPSAEGCAPSFFQGAVQAYRGAPGAPGAPGALGGAFLLWDRASRVRVPLDGSPIEAAVAPRSREIHPGSAAGMIHIALALALRRLGLFHLHAAALVHPSGAPVLVAGGSGAGKTTTAIALIEAGYAYLGDDAIFLRDARAEGAALLAYPRKFHVGPATQRAFPRLAPLARPSPGHRDKLAIDPREAFPGRARAASPLPALVLFPSVADAGSTEMPDLPLARADALGLLLISSAAVLIEGAPRRAENIALLRRLVVGANSYEIRLGRDVLAEPTAAIAPHIERALAIS